MVLGSLIGLGIGMAGGISVGNHLFSHADRVDLRKYDIAADKDDSVPTPDPPEGQTVAGKPREFLKYAPMWAAHPDHDRVLWMNTALKTLWPYYNNAVGKMVLEQVGPALDPILAKTPFVQAVDIETIDLGSKAPAIGGVKSYSSSSDEATIECTLMWGSDAKVRVSVRVGIEPLAIYIPAEVSNIQMRATARVTLAPLVESLPCLGAVTITLLEEPYVDLSLALIGGLDLMQLPGVRDGALYAAQTVLGSMLVYPNRMSFDIMPNGGNPPAPLGLLHIRVVDVDVSSGGLSLPHLHKEVPVVEVSVRAGRAVKSQPGKNDASPELHDLINMVVDDPEEQSLSVRLVDEDGIMKKVIGLGELRLDEAEFMAAPRAVTEVNVQLHKADPSLDVLKLVKVGAKGAGKVAGFGVRTAAKIATLGHLGKKKDDSAGQTKAQKRQRAVVGSVKLEVEYVPFKVAGDKAAMARRLTRRMSRSKINADHKGVLTVNLIKATNLASANNGDVDPFVELALYDPATNSHDVLWSSHMVNEPNPKWGEKFDFTMISATSRLNITVWDKLNFFEGRFSLKGLTGHKETKQKIGTLRLPVEEIVRNAKIRDSWALQETQKGDITLALEWMPVELDD
ncbi:hypothetical protein WJX81_002318 [Elliptochloris bilobata]|uniref:C2 domain-containing protein n=1 Tax=Elliptochloris bilobata TaxID=381761 RepID=A0AAW1QVU6_9CHLO